MEINPSLIREEKFNQIRAKLEYGYNNSTPLEKELLGHILALNKWIDILAPYRKSLHQVAIKVLGVSLGEIFRDDASMLERAIVERFEKKSYGADS